MKKLNILATITLGIGTVVLGLYLLLKLGFQKVILPSWVVMLTDLIIVIGGAISTYCIVKQNKENKKG